MGWRDVLSAEDETLVAPWTGGRTLHLIARSFRIRGALPDSAGWYCFEVEGRSVRFSGTAEPDPMQLGFRIEGYLVADRLVPDDISVQVDMRRLAASTQQVLVVPSGLERFARVSAGRVCEGGALVFAEELFPLGPEPEVRDAFGRRAQSLGNVPGVVPALDAAFRFECFRRDAAQRRRVQAERARQRRALVEELGSAKARRARAAYDFEGAARAALAVSGATYIDHRGSHEPHEVVVRFRIGSQAFECICHARTLRIIDAGVCLTDDDTGLRGDEFFTLESLPGVIQQAQREDALVVFRHVAE